MNPKAPMGSDGTLVGSVQGKNLPRCAVSQVLGDFYFGLPNSRSGSGTQSQEWALNPIISDPILAPPNKIKNQSHLVGKSVWEAGKVKIRFPPHRNLWVTGSHYLCLSEGRTTVGGWRCSTVGRTLSLHLTGPVSIPGTP